jgi:catechol 2,3-dioxygenase-like lactoylglutathione lyase family enzyme
MTRVLLTLFLLTTADPVTLGWSQEASRSDAPLVLGLDHIPLAVKDLDRAAERYRRLGFTLKPGRAHENGIRNQHIKFPDGSEIELVTVSEARDPQTSEYLEHVAAGDGPAFVGFYAPDLDGVARQLEDMGRAFRREGGLLAFPETDGLRYIFFGRRNRSPTDRPEHFSHANGGDGLVGVWLASDDFSLEREILTRLGAKIVEEKVHVPEALSVPVARLQEAQVVFLPGEQQRVPGRRIIGATVRTRNLDSLMGVLAEGGFSALPEVKAENGRSVFLPPSLTHGIWLEFRETPSGAARAGETQ